MGLLLTKEPLRNLLSWADFPIEAIKINSEASNNSSGGVAASQLLTAAFLTASAQQFDFFDSFKCGLNSQKLIINTLLHWQTFFAMISQIAKGVVRAVPRSLP